MKFAPIAFFAYKRPWHTQKALESLSLCEGAVESELFIFCDGSKRTENAKAVEEVRMLVKSRKWCGQVNIVEREKNLGLAQSIIAGVTEIVNKYGSIIVLEDDMVTSPYFLKFMNEALEFYKDEDKVISIHGYIYPVETQLPETFFLRGADCWGWATWKRGWDLFEPDGQKLLHELKEKKLQKRFDINGAYPYTKMLKDQIKGKNNSWAVRWYASAFLQDKLTLYPGNSLIYNTGLDASGTHCSITNIYDAEISRKPVVINTISVEENLFALKEIEKYLRSTKKSFTSLLGRKLINY